MAPDETQLLYSIVLHGRAELGLAPDEYSGLVMVLLRLLAFAPAAGPGYRAATTPESTTDTISATPARAPAAARLHEAGAARIPARAGRIRTPPTRVVTVSAEPRRGRTRAGRRRPIASPLRRGRSLPRRPCRTRPPPPMDRPSWCARLLATAGSNRCVPAGTRRHRRAGARVGDAGAVRVASKACSGRCASSARSLRAPAQREKLAGGAARGTGRAGRRCRSSSARPRTHRPRREAAERARRQQQAEKDHPRRSARAGADDAVHARARIVPGSVKPH